MFFTFLDLIEPAHNIAKPHCMRKIIDPQTRESVTHVMAQWVSLKKVIKNESIWTKDLQKISIASLSAGGIGLILNNSFYEIYISIFINYWEIQIPDAWHKRYQKRELYLHFLYFFAGTRIWNVRFVVFVSTPWGLHIFFYVVFKLEHHNAVLSTHLLFGCRIRRWLYFCFSPFEQHFILTISRLSDITKRYEGDPSTSLHTILKQLVPLSS